MTGYKKVFIDTAPLVYFLDDSAQYADKVESILTEIMEQGSLMETSVITCEEYLVYPYRTDNREKVRAFYDFTSDCGVSLRPITKGMAEKTARIRAQYPSFKAMDALQLASAVELGCDIFLTNDKQLRQFSELRCVTVDEWKLATQPDKEPETAKTE